MSDYTAAGGSRRSEAIYGLSVDNPIVTGPDAIISNFNLFHLKPSFGTGYHFSIAPENWQKYHVRVSTGNPANRASYFASVGIPSTNPHLLQAINRTQVQCFRRRTKVRPAVGRRNMDRDEQHYLPQTWADYGRIGKFVVFHLRFHTPPIVVDAAGTRITREDQLFAPNRSEHGQPIWRANMSIIFDQHWMHGVPYVSGRLLQVQFISPLFD